jgi:hypothetical protein
MPAKLDVLSFSPKEHGNLPENMFYSGVNIRAET